MGLIGSIAGGLTSAVGGALAAKARNKGYNDYINMFQDRMQQVKDHRDNLYFFYVFICPVEYREDDFNMILFASIETADARLFVVSCTLCRF